LAPALEVDDVVYTSNGDTRIYDVSPIALKKFGARVGIEGKFNRTLSWAYGGEVGYRPSIEGRGFYALLKISLPVFGTNLNYKVESFGRYQGRHQNAPALLRFFYYHWRVTSQWSWKPGSRRPYGIFRILPNRESYSSTSPRCL